MLQESFDEAVSENMDTFNMTVRVATRCIGAST